MESHEGKNSNLSDASSAKYNIQVGPALWTSCAKNRFFFPVPKQLGRNGVLPGNHGFFSFRHWLLVEPLEWNEIRISGDLSSPLTRYRLSLCRRFLPNGIIVRFIPRSSKKTDSSYSSFSYPLSSSSLVLMTTLIDDCLLMAQSSTLFMSFSKWICWSTHDASNHSFSCRSLGFVLLLLFKGREE